MHTINEQLYKRLRWNKRTTIYNPPPPEQGLIIWMNLQIERLGRDHMLNGNCCSQGSRCEYRQTWAVGRRHLCHAMSLIVALWMYPGYYAHLKKIESRDTSLLFVPSGLQILWFWRSRGVNLPPCPWKWIWVALGLVTLCVW